MKKLSKNKKTLIRIFVSTLLLIVGLILSSFDYEIASLIIFILSYLIVGYDIIFSAVRNIFKGKVFDENFLMSIASIGAFFVGEYPEAVLVLLLYQLGEVFQRYAVGKSRRNISNLMDIRPDKAFLLIDGKEKEVMPEEVKKGDLIIIHAGDRVPLDGIIVSGSGSVDLSALTGESVPVYLEKGDTIMSGGINLEGLLTVECVNEYYDSTVSKILELVENASDKKAKAENYITKFAKYYTPIVVILAVIVAVLPSLITGDWSKWIYTALTFLVVSCPCAIVISVPLTFFSGIGCASKHGILVKGSNYIEMLSKANIFVFDKTGTITKGNFVVTDVLPENNREEIIKYALIAEHGSLHPIARAIKQLGEIDAKDYEVSEISGKGMKAEKDGIVILAGNSTLMEENGIKYESVDKVGSFVYVAVNGEYKGVVVIADQIKETSALAIKALKDAGNKTIMLTGDNSQNADYIASQVGIDTVYSRLLPADKVEKLEEILVNKSQKDVVAFLGDGINDAPVLMRSDVGIAMGGVGSDSAIEASDVVLMYDDLSSLTAAKSISKKTISIVNQNIIFSLIVKIGIMIISLIGFPNMFLAVFADVGVSFIAILNAIRASKYKNKSQKQVKIN